MKPMNCLRIASITLFSIGLGDLAIANEGGDQSHGAAGHVPTETNQVTIGVDGDQGIAGHSHEVVSHVSTAEKQVTKVADGDQEIVDQASKQSSQVITRAQFTTKVVNREPIDQLDNIDTSVSRVYFFTELTNLSGQTVTHRWLYDGTKMAEVKIMVKADRWRAHSTKNMMPNWTGTWAVAVIDGEGNEITRKTFDYVNPVKTANVEETKQAME